MKLSDWTAGRPNCKLCKQPSKSAWRCAWHGQQRPENSRAGDGSSAVPVSWLDQAAAAVRSTGQIAMSAAWALFCHARRPADEWGARSLQHDAVSAA